MFLSSREGRRNRAAQIWPRLAANSLLVVMLTHVHIPRHQYGSSCRRFSKAVGKNGLGVVEEKWGEGGLGWPVRGQSPVLFGQRLLKTQGEEGDEGGATRTFRGKGKEGSCGLHMIHRIRGVTRSSDSRLPKARISPQTRMCVAGCALLCCGHTSGKHWGNYVLERGRER